MAAFKWQHGIASGKSVSVQWENDSVLAGPAADQRPMKE